MTRKIVIVGGVAGGATAAARLRRLSETDEIMMFERGPHISFANCGLPYFIGDVIKKEDALLIQTPESFKRRFNVDVRIDSEVVKINPRTKCVTVKGRTDGKTYEETYDALILSPGANPIKPLLPGIDDDRIFTLKTVSDAAKIKLFISEHKSKSAVVVGAGFIGLEMAENLDHAGIKVTVVERLDQVLPPLDPEIANAVTQHMKLKNISFILSSGITSFDKGASLAANIENGEKIDCDLVIISVGIRPDTKIAIDAGIETDKNGAIVVNERLQTNLPSIYAVGDAIEVKNPTTGNFWSIALAGPANRQARVVADVINGLDASYSGTLGTSIVKIFDLTVASTGCSEKYLKALDITYDKIYTHTANHVGYYPGATTISSKLIFDPKTGKILGAQMVGANGVDRRIDVVATAMQGGITAAQLKNLELAYAPPYGAAKDPINMVGFIAENSMTGKTHLCHWHEIENFIKNPGKYCLLDVRSVDEFALGSIEGAVNIPIDELRKRHGEIPKEKTIILFCQVGFRGYVAERILMQFGFKCCNLSGGYKTYIQATVKEVQKN